MSRLRHLAPAAFALALFSVAGASAQDLDGWCDEQAHIVCGDDGRNLLMGQCMSRGDMWSKMPDHCHGYLQMTIEMEREALAEEAEQRRGASQGGGGQWTGNEPRRRDDRAASNMVGYSYGGILREGPGMDFRKMASLHEGQQVEILSDTGIWFNDYKWFRVSTSQGTGFHWGGIFCTEGGDTIEGVFGSCN